MPKIFVTTHIIIAVTTPVLVLLNSLLITEASVSSALAQPFLSMSFDQNLIQINEENLQRVWGAF
ncbi:hypothetical protein [Nodosilinea nodulosa]|uniref:hypothetical protein n=1 Tax=Nodosilinea nodulosa TaxID=416001 RepID=UPI0002E9C4D1|nr:hypothetical protein [Nodosilinea nodulosa]